MPQRPPASPTFVLHDTTALLVIDVQNDFLPGGSLAVPRGNEIIPRMNAIAAQFRTVVLTQDWHPSGHVSFASHHPGKAPFETVALPYGPQVLWPDHCVQGTEGAAIAAALQIPHAQMIIRKGCTPSIDSYSAFIEADGHARTGLEGYLRERGITAVCVAGLATDFCVAWTALDARKLGFEVCVIDDACRAIDANGSLADAWSKMTAVGVVRTTSTE